LEHASFRLRGKRLNYKLKCKKDQSPSKNPTKTYPDGDDHAYFYDALGRIRTHTTPTSLGGP
jgi:hypothetical protein